MGWIFLYEASEKRQVIDACTQDNDNLKCIRKATYSSELWTIWENTETKHKYIVLFLLAQSQGNWGYKDITENMGPRHYQCPLSFLDEVPVANEEWREKVRQHNADKRRNKRLLREIYPGKVVTLKESSPRVFRVITTKPFLGVALEDNLTYKLVKSKVIEVSDAVSKL